MFQEVSFQDLEEELRLVNFVESLKTRKKLCPYPSNKEKPVKEFSREDGIIQFLLRRMTGVLSWSYSKDRRLEAIAGVTNNSRGFLFCFLVFLSVMALIHQSFDISQHLDLQMQKLSLKVKNLLKITKLVNGGAVIQNHL